MLKRASLPLALSLAFAWVGVNAQTIKEVPIVSVTPTSGVAMYKEYCAVCHGLEGKGNGPAATAMKKAPTDLTLLAKNHGGKYPAEDVASSIRGDTGMPSHGAKDMPIWGDLFRSGMGHRPEGEVQLRIVNLTSYIQTLQAK